LEFNKAAKLNISFQYFTIIEELEESRCDQVRRKAVQAIHGVYKFI
jgi:hypothetical protein